MRNYIQERKTLLARGEDKGHAERNQARRDAVKAGRVKTNDGQDVSHKKALSKGGSNKPSNTRIESQGANRSFRRNSDGSMK